MKNPSARTSTSKLPNCALPDGLSTVVVRPVSPIRNANDSYPSIGSGLGANSSRSMPDPLTICGLRTIRLKTGSDGIYRPTIEAPMPTPTITATI